MRLLTIMATAVCALAALRVGARAQADHAQFVGRSSELVALPVTVTDKHGRFVPDLPLGRFAVYDNGRPQAILVFSHEDTPVTIGILVDTSGSMRARLVDVVAAAVSLARSSNPDDEVFAIAFNDSVRDPLGGRFLSADDADALRRTMSTFVPIGQTALYDALVAGLDRIDAGTRPRRAVVLISDGGDNASSATRDQVLARARRSGVTIYTIGLLDQESRENDPGLLRTLAQTTGGERFLPRSNEQLMQDCQRIAREIRHGYTIGYLPPEQDGAYHRVSVQVSTAAGERLIVRTRPGYVAARSVESRQHD
jgi:Ca-activated chloride channel family protein